MQITAAKDLDAEAHVSSGCLEGVNGKLPAYTKAGLPTHRNFIYRQNGKNLQTNFFMDIIFILY